MMRLIDADALIDEAFERYCKDCNKRKGVKNGKYRIIYSVGDAPCRACSTDDMKDDIDSAPTIDAVPVVRCKDCRERDNTYWCPQFVAYVDEDFYCAYGERKDDVV